MIRRFWFFLRTRVYRGDIVNVHKPLCRGCIYLYTTWDKNFAYGCKAMGFKSARLPCEVVRQSSGQECLAYVEKPSRGEIVVPVV